MSVRQPVRAGMFYESSPSACGKHASELLSAAELPDDLPAPLYGGVVPHAGWTFSGALAAKTFKALNQAGPLQTVVLLGADHTGAVRLGEVYAAGAWQTPLGESAVDEELAAALVAGSELLRANPQAHAREHSIEVQLPILQALCPSAQIVPVAVPPTDQALPIGQAIGKAIAQRSAKACVVASTDLTHHGSAYGFKPGGSGEKGVRWAEANDQRMIALMESLEAEQVVAESQGHHNACGAGAIAAALAACREMGATRGICLEYTNSYHVIRKKYPYELDDTSVGYASVVFA